MFVIIIIKKRLFTFASHIFRGKKQKQIIHKTHASHAVRLNVFLLLRNTVFFFFLLPMQNKALKLDFDVKTKTTNEHAGVQN